MNTGPLRCVLLAALCIVAIAAVAGCGSSGTSTSSENTGNSTDAASEEGSRETVVVPYSGTQTVPPSTPNKAVPGKSVWVISSGQSSGSSAVPSEFAMDAGKKLGWHMTLFDGELNPSRWSAGVRQAVAAGADGIVLVAVNCPDVKAALEEAKKANIPVNGSVISFDCSELEPGQPSLITAPTNFGDRYEDLVAWQEAWAKANADWVIEQSDGKASSILLDNQQFSSLSIAAEVFKETFKSECSGCKVTDVPMTVEELGPPLASTVQTALVKEPAATTVAFAATPLAGVSQGVVQAGRAEEVKVISGTGLPEEFEALESGEAGLNALVAKPQQWAGYAAIDTLNSVFAGRQPEDEGIGFQVFDEAHLPAQGVTEPFGDDIPAIYVKRWGIG